MSPGNGGFGHLGLLHEKLLDFTRIDVEAAGDDEVTQAPAQGVVAVRRNGGQVSGVEPSVAKDGPGSFRLPPIAPEDIRALQPDLASLTLRDGLALCIEKAH